MRVVRLPVNVGAPAARNWLLAEEDVRKSDWCAFLDDDILLPRDWLGRMGAAMRAVPGASVYGCRIKDPSGGRLQAVDLHLRPDYGQGKDAAPHSAPDASDLHLQERGDLGQFDYLRPCLSVTGCCHLFDTRAILEAGGFDIRFSPSQFDDLDLDLRLFRAGGHAVYQGHVPVAHMRRTGAEQGADPVAAANAKGNREKLGGKLPRARQAEVARREAGLLREDLRAKRKAVWEALPRDCDHGGHGLLSLCGMWARGSS